MIKLIDWSGFSRSNRILCQIFIQSIEYSFNSSNCVSGRLFFIWHVNIWAHYFASTIWRTWNGERINLRRIEACMYFPKNSVRFDPKTILDLKTFALLLSRFLHHEKLISQVIVLIWWFYVGTINQKIVHQPVKLCQSPVLQSLPIWLMWFYCRIVMNC